MTVTTRRSLPRRSIALLVAAAAALALTPTLAAQEELTARVETLIANSKLAGSRIGVNIVDLATGRTLADVRGDTPLIPASNMKLLTSGSALLVLGGDFVFRTELLIDADRLVIKGGGDPALADPSVLDRMTPRMSVDGLVEALAAAVRQAGVSHVSQVIVDDRIFDRQYVHPSWPRDQLDRWYCAEVSGVNFHTNVLSAFPRPSPSGPGHPPVVALEPTAPWLEIETRARTVGDGKNSVWLSRDAESNRFTLFGEVRYPAKVPIEITLHDSATLTGQLIAAELPRAGVGVGPTPPLAEGRTRLGRDELAAAIGAVSLAGPTDTYGGRTVAAVTTHIRDILERCNSDSQNLYAESLIKRIGHEVTGEPGSWTNGSSVVRMTISQHLGAGHAASTVVADGSGMSRENRVAPRTLTRWLDHLQRNTQFGNEYVESMATPGDGTLRRRFSALKLNGTLRAKSGKLDGVRCLSGYVTDPDTGRRVAFSVMVNELKEGEQALQSLQFHEEVVALIDRWLVTQRPSTSSRQNPSTAPRATRTEPSRNRVKNR